MYKVVIGLKDVAETESLAEACRTFISKVKDLISDGGCSEQFIFQTCMITTEIDGVGCMMNFHAIRDFSHGIGILNEEGNLSDKPVPYVPKTIADQIFVAASNASFTTFMEENAEVFAKLAEAWSARDDQETAPQIIT